jgi:hypothetical protein
VDVIKEKQTDDEQQAELAHQVFDISKVLKFY